MSKIALVGDIHGDIEQMYKDIQDAEKNSSLKIDSILQVGDFHAIRDEYDLKRFPAPARHRKMGEFSKYYREGEVPKKTFFIGGNHENNYWLSEFPEGKEIIHNLFYLGRAGVKEIENIKVGWVSGNYSPTSYAKTKGGGYNHFKSEDMQAVINKKENIDVLLLHDWPSMKGLKDYIVNGTVSDPEAMEYSLRRGFGSNELLGLVKEVKPKYIFCGHMHLPLDLEVMFDKSKIKFVSLNRLGRKNSIALLDTDTLKSDFIPKEKICLK